jgi:hypothetical protein
VLSELATLPLRQTSAMPGPVPTRISYALCLATGGTQLKVGSVSVPSGSVRELTCSPAGAATRPSSARAWGAAASGREAPAAAAVMIPIMCRRLRALES